jgi:SAM-dependent methyltransferase
VPEVSASISPTGVSSSFRDPAGAVVICNDRVFRCIGTKAQAEWQTFEECTILRAFMDAGSLVTTRSVPKATVAQLLSDTSFACAYARVDARLIVEHERIPFPSYPYEWAPEMLHAAGELTLNITEQLLPDGAGLKDGTPYNVMFRGAQPVFLDVLSFERRHERNPMWLAEAQFIRTFVLPLIAWREVGLPLDQIFLTRRDGLEPRQIVQLIGRLACLRPGLFGSVLMPVLLSSKGDGDEKLFQTTLLGNTEKARFILRATYSRLRKTLSRARPPLQSSTWSTYMAGNNNYTKEHLAAKEQFVQCPLKEFRPRRVLDVGCNTGRFSVLAAESGASVVAVDYDPIVVGRVWRVARSANLDVLPLVVNLTRPTPGVGWRNRECASFLERARGRFDLVLMLAVIHHMLVTEGIPLEEIVLLASELTVDLAIVEYVGPEDSMFKRLVRGRGALHDGFTVEVFESACAKHFDIVRSLHVESTNRRLYLLRKKRSESAA